MIFITLGTQPCDFSRCLEMVEALKKEYNIHDKIVAQVGHTKYHPKDFECVEFVSEEKYQQYIESADVIISHAGTGALFSSMNYGKKIIAVARLAEYGEMINNHQLDIIRKLSEGGYILDGTHSIIDAWEKLETFTPRPCDFKCTLPCVIKEQIDKWIE